MQTGDIERIRQALSFIPADERDTWVRIGMGIKAELGEAGFELWDAWSQQAESYDTRAAKDVWKSIGANGKVTTGTLFYLAAANGWRDDCTIRIPTSEELAERRQAESERAAREEGAIARERAKTAKMAAAVWSVATEATPKNPYLLRKNVAPLPTLREIEAGNVSTILGYIPQSGGAPLTGPLLVVPIEARGSLTTLELIDGAGRKVALVGRGTKTGGYWAAQPLPTGLGHGVTLLIAEGVATAMSAREATGHPAIATLADTNLSTIASSMRERFPAARLVILADLLKSNSEPNPCAIEAARISNGKLAIPAFSDRRLPGATDFNDMAQLSGADAVARVIEDACSDAPNLGNGSAPAAANGGWPEPQPFTAKIEPEPYPIDALPPTIRAAVEEVAAFVQAPIPMVASSALAALSVAAQAHVDVKRADKLQGPIGLFLLTIADSGERKSTCDGFFSAPIRKYEQEQADAMKPLMDHHEAASAAWTAERDGLLSAIKDAGKKARATDKLKVDLAALQQRKPRPPRVPRMLLGDDTPENLAWRLATEWPSSGVVSAEAGIILGAHGMGKDSAMRNLSLHNILWDGGELSVGRRTTVSFTVRGARLTLALQIQEAALRSFVARTGELARGTGWFARFLIAWPPSTQGFRLFKEAPPSWPNLTDFHRRIEAILAQPPPIGDDGALSPAIMVLSSKAKYAWVSFHDAIEVELSSGGKLHNVRDAASKIADNAARLATLFQIIDHGFCGSVGLEAFDGASRIAAWHLHEGRRFFGELALPPELADAARLETWLIEHCLRRRVLSVGKNHVRQHGPLRDQARLDAAIRELANVSRLRLGKDGTRQTIDINPQLLREAP